MYLHPYIQGVSKLNSKTSSYKETKKVYDNMGPNMYGNRIAQACIYRVHANTS
jgi:hypothetical protein